MHMIDLKLNRPNAVHSVVTFLFYDRLPSKLLFKVGPYVLWTEQPRRSVCFPHTRPTAHPATGCGVRHRGDFCSLHASKITVRI